MEKFLLLMSKMAPQQAFEILDSLSNEDIGFLVVQGITLPIPVSLRSYVSHAEAYLRNNPNPAPLTMAFAVNGIVICLNCEKYTFRGIIRINNVTVSLN